MPKIVLRTMTKKNIYANFRHARIVEVLKIEVNEGDGAPDDPITRVVYLVGKDGTLLAKVGENRKRNFAGEDEMTKL